MVNHKVVAAITGLEKIHQGSISIDGKDITNEKIRNRSIAGISHIPEDRHKYGLVLDYPLEYNMVLQDTGKNLSKNMDS